MSPGYGDGLGVCFFFLKSLSLVRLYDPVDCVAYQVPLSMVYSKQEYWSGLPVPSPGDLPRPGIEPRSLALQADSLPSEPPGKPSLPNLFVFGDS